MGRRAMRIAGAALMEAGNQALILRREQLEEQRQQRLESLQKDRLGLMEKDLNQQAEYQQGQLGIAQGEADAKMKDRQYKAVNDVQERIDKVLKPGDMEMQEYMTAREAIVKNSVDMDPEEITAQLDALKQQYIDNAAEGMDPKTEAGQQSLAERRAYVNRVNNILDKGNQRLKMVFGDSFQGTVADYVDFSADVQADRDYREEVANTPLEEVAVGAERQAGGVSTDPATMKTSTTAPSRSLSEATSLSVIPEALGGLMGSALGGAPSEMGGEIAYDPWARGFGGPDARKTRMASGGNLPPVSRSGRVVRPEEGQPGLMDKFKGMLFDSRQRTGLRIDADGNVIPE